MRSNKELENTTSEELINWIFDAIRRVKDGQKTSVELLMNEYYYGNNYYRINPNLIYNMVVQEARERFILLDFTESEPVNKAKLFKTVFAVWKKKKYISEDDFRDLCEEYDILFVDVDTNDKNYEKNKKKIITNWKKECSIFKRNPNIPRRPKRIVRIKDLDTTPFDKPTLEHIPLKGINIIPIGSGSDGNSFYIEIGNHKFLVDAGISFKTIESALTKNGLHTENIEAVFITHGHSDHISCIKQIYKSINCPVYTGKETSHDLVELGVKSVIIDPNERMEVLPGLFVTMFPADHDYYFTYGFVFECEGSKVSYLTDNGYTKEKQLKLMYGSDVAVLEANFDLDRLEKRGVNDLTYRVSIYHSSNIRCGYNMISLHEHGTRNFLLAHVSKVNNTHSLIESTVRTMLRSRFANIHICQSESDELLCY